MCEDYSAPSCKPFLDLLKEVSKRKAVPGDSGMRKSLKNIYDKYSRNPFTPEYLKELEDAAVTHSNMALATYKDIDVDIKKVKTLISELRDVSKNKIVEEHIKNTIGIFGDIDITIIDIFRIISYIYDEIDYQITRDKDKVKTQKRVKTSQTELKINMKGYPQTTEPPPIYLKRHVLCNEHSGKETDLCSIKCIIPELSSISICHVDNTIYIAYSGAPNEKLENLIGEALAMKKGFYKKILFARDMNKSYLFPYKYIQDENKSNLYECYSGLECSEPKIFTHIKTNAPEEHKRLITTGNYKFGCMYIGSAEKRKNVIDYLVSASTVNDKDIHSKLRERAILSYLFYNSGIKFLSDLSSENSIDVSIGKYYTVLLRLMKPCIGCLMNHKEILNMDDLPEADWDSSDCKNDYDNIKKSRNRISAAEEINRRRKAVEWGKQLNYNTNNPLKAWYNNSLRDGGTRSSRNRKLERKTRKNRK